MITLIIGIILGLIIAKKYMDHQIQEGKKKYTEQQLYKRYRNTSGSIFETKHLYIMGLLMGPLMSILITLPIGIFIPLETYIIKTGEENIVPLKDSTYVKVLWKEYSGKNKAIVNISYSDHTNIKEIEIDRFIPSNSDIPKIVGYKHLLFNPDGFFTSHIQNYFSWGFVMLPYKYHDFYDVYSPEGSFDYSSYREKPVNNNNNEYQFNTTRYILQ